MTSLPTIPGYQLESLLGAGGMGVVYAASRADTPFKYAIKMLLAGRNASTEDLARFRIEAEAYACLNHRCIIKIRDVGVVSGCPYLAMDYAENGSLDKFIKKMPTLDVEWRLQTIRDVAEALSHAHGRRILHRDLKPANILISADGTPKLTDFGLVKFSAPLSAVSQSCCTFAVSALDEHLLRMATENKSLLPMDEACQEQAEMVETLSRRCAERSGLTTESFNIDDIQDFVVRSVETRRFSGELSGLLDDMTRIGAVLGSPQFMSPEQAQGQIDRIGPHTDVYGLGATLYYLLAGQPPITGEDVAEVVRNVVHVEPVSPDRINRALPEDLSLVVMKAIDKEPANRYPNMEMFGEDLDRLLSGRSPLAKLHAHTRSASGSVMSMVRAVGSSISTVFLARSKGEAKPNETE